MRDVTKLNLAQKELKQAHEKLQNLNKELEEKVKKRTFQIQDLLKQKDEFINQLGHDLKNPLNPLINLFPILERDEKNPERKEMFAVIKRNLDYMRNLVIKTIELARLNSPNTRFSFESLNLAEIINNGLEKNKPLFELNNVKIKNKINNNLFVKADKLRLEELFDNLMINAVKYSPYGGLITFNAKKDDDFVTISINDTGRGIEKNQIDHIFEEFYKTDQSRHDFESSGLGLPICKRIVEKHGGKIWAKSPGPGKGTTMEFTLMPAKNNN
jgi:signal transduction histidine kinase